MLVVELVVVALVVLGGSVDDVEVSVLEVEGGTVVEVDVDETTVEGATEEVDATTVVVVG